MAILAIIACTLIGAWTGLLVSRPYIESRSMILRTSRDDDSLGSYVSETETIFLIVGSVIGAGGAGAVTLTT
ncbi:hypothetical protein ACMYR2_2356 [Nitrobacter sp. TKz-YC01]